MTSANLDAEWKALYKVGALAAWAMLVLMPVQAAAFMLAPPPTTVAGFFTLFQQNPLLGLLSLDLVYMLEILLAGLVLLVLCVALRRASPPLVTLALFFNLAAVSIYFASNTAFEMLSLSARYAAASTDAQRQTLLAAGEARALVTAWFLARLAAVSDLTTSAQQLEQLRLGIGVVAHDEHGGLLAVEQRRIEQLSPRGLERAQHTRMRNRSPSPTCRLFRVSVFAAPLPDLVMS